MVSIFQKKEFSVLIFIPLPLDNAETGLEGFTQKNFLELKKLNVDLMHVAPGKIKTGRYTVNIHFSIPAHFPSSMYLQNGSIEYRVRARIPRKDPSADITQDCIVWVLNSNITDGRRHGEELSPCPVPEISNGSTFSTAAHSGSATTGLSFTCEVPTTVLIAGETLAIAIEATPGQPSERTSGYDPSLFSNESQSGLLSKVHGKHHEQDELSKMPTLRVNLKQVVSYHHLERRTSERENRKFSSVFRFDKERGDALLSSHGDGWNVVLKMILPRLGAKRVDLEKMEVQDELEGLKASLEHSLLKIEHSLEIKLEYNTAVRRFKSKQKTTDLSPSYL